MSTFALYFSLLVSAGSLAWGWYAGAFPAVAEAWLGVALFWTLALIRRWTWVSSLGLFAAVALAASGLWIGLGVGWMAAGAIGALLVWDLTDFRERLRLAAESDDRPQLERRHLARLTLLALIGALLFGLGMLLRLRLSFEWGALLLLVAGLGLTQLIGWLRRGEEE